MILLLRYRFKQTLLIQRHGERADVALFPGRFGNRAAGQVGDTPLVLADGGAEPAFLCLDVRIRRHDTAVFALIG